mgnify:CR=1 FL=1
MNPIKELHNQIVDEMVIALEERAPKTLAYLNMKLYDLARNIGSIT